MGKGVGHLEYYKVYAMFVISGEGCESLICGEWWRSPKRLTKYVGLLLLGKQLEGLANVTVVVQASPIKDSASELVCALITELPISGRIYFLTRVIGTSEVTSYTSRVLPRLILVHILTCVP